MEQCVFNCAHMMEFLNLYKRVVVGVYQVFLFKKTLQRWRLYELEFILFLIY